MCVHLRSYSNNADLHIGVTDSKGRIFSYDEGGLKEDGSSAWDECLCVECAFIEDAWDTELEKCLQSKDWTSSRYGLFIFLANFEGDLRF